MKSLLLTAILQLSVIMGFSQNWSDPIIVSNGGYNYQPDFTIDKFGTIHCVWSHEIAENFFKIYYAKSTDNGYTWSTPTDISHNTKLWMDTPHVVADSLNNLHVVFDYNVGDYSNTRICYIMFDGNSWSLPVFLADDMPGASHNRLVVDHNNRVFCFWHYGTFVYRVLENGIWGNSIQPYIWNQDKYFLNRVIVDKQNNLHCIGIHHYQGQTSYDDRVIYFSLVSNQWNNFREISDTMSWANCDIGLKSNGFPKFTWGQLRPDSAMAQSCTYYAEMDDSGMTVPQLLAFNGYEAAIGVDLNDKTHIVDSEKISFDSFQLVYHYRDSVGWARKILQKSREFNQISLKSYESSIYIMYKRYEHPDPYVTSILFSKLNIETGMAENDNKEKIKIYPVPFSDQLTISLTPTGAVDATITLRDCFGRSVYNIYKGKTTPGNMKFYMNNLDLSSLRPAVYYFDFQLGNKRINRNVIYTPDKY